MRRRRRRLVSRSLHYNDRESLALFAYETHSLCDSAECGGAFAGARGLGNLCPNQIMNMLHDLHTRDEWGAQRRCVDTQRIHTYYDDYFHCCCANGRRAGTVLVVVVRCRRRAAIAIQRLNRTALLSLRACVALRVCTCVCVL